MPNNRKIGREKKKRKNKNPQWAAFVTNKWNGKEPYIDFQTREWKAWNNLPSSFKNPLRDRLKKT